MTRPSPTNSSPAPRPPPPTSSTAQAGSRSGPSPPSSSPSPPSRPSPPAWPWFRSTRASALASSATSSSDSAPERLLAVARRRSPDSSSRRYLGSTSTATRAGDEPLPDELGEDDVAFVMYTSGTTGPPKGVQIPRRAIASNLDALAEIWQWTADDRLTHALPVFHVHGLVIGLLGPLRRGGQLEHAGRFSPQALARALTRGATMVFGVPTMYSRIAKRGRDRPRPGGRLREGPPARVRARRHSRRRSTTPSNDSPARRSSSATG